MESCLRIPPDHLYTLVVEMFEKSGTSHEDAELIGRLLGETDLRGVFTHGTRQIPS